MSVRRVDSILTIRILFDSLLRNMLRLGWEGFGLDEQCKRRFCKSVDGLSALLNLWRTASGEWITRRDINVEGVRGSKFERAVDRIDGEFGHCIFEGVMVRSGGWGEEERGGKIKKDEKKKQISAAMC
jgi:hypothetical protein